MSKAEKKVSSRTIHVVIGIVIMLIFRFLPNLPQVTDVGMNVLGAFAGTLYLWITIDTLTASLMSFAMVVFTGYAPVDTIINSYLHPTLIPTMFILIMSGALITTNVTQYVARFFLTAKINRGRPWVFASMVLLASFIMSLFVDWLAPIFLLWPILYGIFDELGYKKGDKFPTVLVILVIIGDTFGYHVFPFMRNPLALISNFKTLTADSPNGPVIIEDGGYLLSALIISIVFMVAIMLVTRFVFRPDTSKFKNYDVDSLRANPLPKMNVQQKTVSGVFILMIAFLMIPALLARAIPFMGNISAYTNVMAALAIVLLCVIQVDKKPVIDFNKIMKEQIPWPMISMIMAAFLLAGAITNEATGVTLFLDYALSPIFAKMSVTAFTVAIILVTVVLTNICNSFVISIVMSPIVITYCTMTGANAAPIGMLVIFASLCTAIGTPSGSPFAATLYGNNEWLIPKKVYKYSITYIVVEVIVLLLVGIPVARLFL